MSAIQVPLLRCLLESPPSPRPHLKRRLPSPARPRPKPRSAQGQQIALKENRLLKQQFMRGRSKPKLSKQQLSKFLSQQQQFQTNRRLNIERAKNEQAVKEASEFMFRPKLSSKTNTYSRATLLHKLQCSQAVTQRRVMQPLQQVTGPQQQRLKTQQIRTSPDRDKKSQQRKRTRLNWQKQVQNAVLQMEADLTQQQDLRDVLRLLGVCNADSITSRQLEAVGKAVGVRGGRAKGLARLLVGLRGLTDESAYLKSEFGFLRLQPRTAGQKLVNLPRELQFRREDEPKPELQHSQICKLYSNDSSSIRIEQIQKDPAWVNSRPAGDISIRESRMTVVLRRPIAELEVGLVGLHQRVVVYEDDQAEQVADSLARRVGLKPQQRSRIVRLVLDQQLRSKRSDSKR